LFSGLRKIINNLNSNLEIILNTI